MSLRPERSAFTAFIIAVTLADLRGKVCMLTVTSNAASARVLLRGREVGVTPMSKPVRVVAGRSILEVVSEGFFPGRREVDLPGGQAATVDLTLMAKATHG